jgi:hypothetical protein
MKKVLGLAGVFLLASAITASAAVYDIFVTGAGDGYYLHNSYPGGSYKHFYSGENAVGASYAYSFSSGYGSETTKVTGYAQFGLSSLAGVDGITNISLNLNILDAYKSGVNGVSAGTINHVADASMATGNGAQQLGGSEYVSSVMPGMSGWTSFDVTNYVLNDIANYDWAAFSFDYDATYTDWDGRYSGFSFSSAESGNPAYLRVVTAGGSNGGDDPTAVPEPATMALFGMGAAGLAFIRRRK